MVGERRDGEGGGKWDILLMCRLESKLGWVRKNKTLREAASEWNKRPESSNQWMDRSGGGEGGGEGRGAGNGGGPWASVFVSSRGAEEVHDGTPLYVPPSLLQHVVLLLPHFQPLPIIPSCCSCDQMKSCCCVVLRPLQSSFLSPSSSK